MTTFSIGWDVSFTLTPASSEKENLGAQRIRETRSAIGERFVVDHSLAGDANDGKHKWVTLRTQIADPTPDGAEPADGMLFSKLGVYPPGTTANELWFRDNNGVLTQVTVNGFTYLRVPIGTVMEFAAISYVGIPAGWLAADGSAISRTTYALAFAEMGVSYGIGDGSTTFNLPTVTQAGYQLGNKIIFVGP